ncbi:MAG: 50S ribosomal protein L10 [Candidatus Colwellbacteria bacterium CG10_big_fil_rev_8_21_14_0_10_42_22]|uniref:Large ribosomal subunit protein uL10 n=1 Tax=Candidatus Colwellbacteria bacterium CG10_big_fil_rev_8_21_14_0_10_42_22 TaxID=1974540 RepID=A0A2H0VHA0_9BACT|nr:MAG: 50S ribosomal protein L10 [Candidatus Colwellbacteria bacterium CG10_big_fil_rev_8_21_14_0_10_42_22]
MAINRQQKENIVKTGAENVNESNALIFTDFSGVNVTDMNSLRSTLRELGSKFKVIKKRLLGVILKDKKIELDPLKYEGELGTVFVKGDISEIAGPLYRFAKDHNTFKLLGAYDLEKREEIDETTINAIGSLPPKEVLLGQVVGSIVAPIRSLLHILSEKSKQS